MGISTAYAAVIAALLAALCYAIGAALEQKEASATATRARRSPGTAVAGAAAPRLAGRVRGHGCRRGAACAGPGVGAARGRPADRRDHGPVRAADRGPGRPPPAASARARRRGRHRRRPGRAAHRDEGLHRGARPGRARPGRAGSGGRSAALAVLTLVALRASGALRTLLLGCGSGIAFGATAALVRLLAHRVELHGVSGLVGWVSPVIAVTAVAGLLLEQGAYKSGHLGVAVAGYTVTDPLVAVALGAWVLHQPARASHPLWAAGEALVVMTGVVLLARATAAVQQPPAAATRLRAACGNAEPGELRSLSRSGSSPFRLADTGPAPAGPPTRGARRRGRRRSGARGRPRTAARAARRRPARAHRAPGSRGR